jgi:hypothetical protein
MGKRNIGSSFDDFLKVEAIHEEATAVALKRAIAWQESEYRVRSLRVFAFVVHSPHPANCGRSQLSFRLISGNVKIAGNDLVGL